MDTNDNTELARYYDENGIQRIITIGQYNQFVAEQNRNAIADFIYNRLHSRYLKPFLYEEKKFRKEYKNGLSIMANCCLLIETLQSFKNGWGDTDGKSGLAYRQFFSTDTNFTELNQKGGEIHRHMRCGILHQGETTGGWKINRADNQELVQDKTIDSILFFK